MAAARLERRAFCLVGTATIAFSGTVLIARLNVAFSWFAGATVTIDGVAPSTLGLIASTDTLSCDAAAYSLTGDAFVDVLVADGLSNGPHTCVITANSTNPAQFFSIAGYRVGILASQPLTRTGGWLVATVIDLNKVMIGVTNRSAGPILNASLTWPVSGLLDGNGDPLTTLTAASLAPGQSLTQVVAPVFTGHEIGGSFAYTLGLSAEYPDVAGAITHTTTVTAFPGSPEFTVVGTWFQDTGGPAGVARIFTSTFGTASIQFTFVGDVLTLALQTSLSWGVLGVYAADGTTQLHGTNCNVDSALPLVVIQTGYGPGSHTVFLKKVTDDGPGAFIVLLSAAWSLTQNYSVITESVILNYVAEQPVALPVQSVVIDAFDVSFDAPVADAQDYSGVPVRENTYLAYTEVLARLPTYAVCYQSGFQDILSQYDILIVDPFAAATADVLAWQQNGIKVFGYISSGEESGFYANRYDLGSALAPNAGAGAGGFATYYMRTADGVNPDRNGIWSSYYIDPNPALGWPTRLETYYAPLVLGGPLVVVDEVVTTLAATISSGAVIVFNTAHAPVDIDQLITLRTMDGSHTYVIYADFTFDTKTGAFILSTTIAPAVTIGQHLKISYTRKGHSMDGVFFDTVDTPDVYASSAFGFVEVPGYAASFINLINNFKAAHPTAWLISNRGFTILPSIIRSCKGVMFESWLTLPTDIAHLLTTDYFQITDPDDIAANETVHTMLRTLRLTHEFDVYSLNYCHNDSRGDALRGYCRAQDAVHGYLSWQSTITLDAPSTNTISARTPGFPISDSAPEFVRYQISRRPL